MNTYIKQIDAAYVNTLVDLVNACRALGVELDKVQYFQNGWRVTFKGFDGDAICHDGSYGSPNHMRSFLGEEYPNDWTQSGSWETIGFPWDRDDVSVHDSQTLAYLISALAHELDWEVYDNKGE